MYLAAGTPPFSGASIWASIFFDALATQHAWTCLSGSITAYVGARMHVSSKQASRHRRFGKSPPPPALGRPGHGAGFFSSSLVFLSCPNLPPSTGIEQMTLFSVHLIVVTVKNDSLLVTMLVVLRTDRQTRKQARVTRSVHMHVSCRAALHQPHPSAASRNPMRCLLYRALASWTRYTPQPLFP